jgi:ParB family transcriptional regulator, chromosome partitioning protein
MSQQLESTPYTASIPLSMVRVRTGHNPRRRFDQEEHDSLCLTLREEGLMHPIAVRKVGEDEYEVIAGERRWRAAKDIGWASIDAKVFVCTEQQARKMARIENLKRVNLSEPIWRRTSWTTVKATMSRPPACWAGPSPSCVTACSCSTLPRASWMP